MNQDNNFVHADTPSNDEHLASSDSSSVSAKIRRTRRTILGSVLLVLTAVAVYHGVRRVMGSSSLDGPVPTDIDTTL